jgi:HAMP domain-containing protein
MADLNVGVKLTTDGSQAIQTVGSYKKELREASQTLLQMQDRFGEFSKEAVNAAKHVAGLKDKIEDSRKLVDAFNPDRKFAAFGQSVQGVVGGFTALQGVMGLVGGESENLQKTLLKVQSAMALTAGLDTLRESAQGFKTMANIIKTNVVGALKSVKTAVAATGIGLLVIAVGTLVAYWDDIKEAVSGVSSEQKKLTKESEKHLQAEKDKLSKLGSQDNVLRLQGKTEKQILDIKAAQIEKAIKAAVINLENQKHVVASQLQAEKRNKSILEGIIKFTTVPLQLIINGIAKIGSWFGKNWGFNVADSIASLIFDPEETEAKGKATIQVLEDEIANMKNQKAGYILEMQAIDKKAQKDEIEQLLSHLKKVNEITQGEGLNERLLNKKATLNAGLSGTNMQGDKNAIAGANQVREDLANEGMTPEEKQLNALEDMYKKRMEMVEGHEALELEVERSFKEQKLALEQYYANQKLGIVAGLLGKAADIVGKQTAAGKVLAIAEATINTWTGATEVLRAKSILPEPMGSIAKGINFAAVLATGFKAVKGIMATKVPGGGSSSAPSVSAGSAAPFAPTPQSTTTSLDQNSINSIGSAAGRAFVLDRDIQNNRELITRLNRAARI